MNFLSSIAECPAFIISGSGLDGIECAKIAKAYKVLTFSSEKKDLNIAMEEAYKT